MALFVLSTIRLELVELLNLAIARQGCYPTPPRERASDNPLGS